MDFLQDGTADDIEISEEYVDTALERSGSKLILGYCSKQSSTIIGEVVSMC